MLPLLDDIQSFKFWCQLIHPHTLGLNPKPLLLLVYLALPVPNKAHILSIPPKTNPTPEPEC